MFQHRLGAAVAYHALFGVKSQGGAFVGGRVSVAVVSIPAAGLLVVGVEGVDGSFEAGGVAGAGAAVVAVREHAGSADAGLLRKLTVVQGRICCPSVVAGLAGRAAVARRCVSR